MATRKTPDDGLDEFAKDNPENTSENSEGNFVDDYDENDPLAPPPPSISWQDIGQGNWIELDVLGIADRQVARNFQTRQPIRYEDGNYAYDVILPVMYKGRRHSLWARVGGNLFKELRSVMQELGRSFRRGDTVSIVWTGDDKKSRAHEFKAVLETNETTA